MISHKDEKEEIAPGVLFKGGKDGYKLCLMDENEEIIEWDYQEICLDPVAWYNSLRAVATAVQFGPSAARKSVRNMKSDVNPPSASLCCNVCTTKFVVREAHPFVFSATLNGHRYLEFQCSPECNEQRKKAIYESELGDAFMDLWKNKVCKTKS